MINTNLDRKALEKELLLLCSEGEEREKSRINWRKSVKKTDKREDSENEKK
jgi:hypothetical protein